MRFNAPTQKKLFGALVSICALFTIHAIFRTISNSNDTIDFIPIPDQSFAKADLITARQYLDNDHGFWPTYQGYNDRFAAEVSSPVDEHLVDRITLAENFMTPPSFRIKGLPRSPGEQFERIIHQTWMDTKIPSKTAPWVEKWLKMNPGWTHMFWTDLTQRAFIHDHFPKLLGVYDSWTIPVQKADMFRYIALYAFGGVYADLDIEVLKPLEEIRDWGSCILSREPDPQVFIMYPPLASWANNYTFACNAFMACRSHHPFLHYLIGRVVQNSRLVSGKPCPLEKTILCTGPWLVSFSYTYYRRSIGQQFRQANPDWDVTCPHYSYFLPTYDPSRRWLLILKCKFVWLYGTEKQQQICHKEQVVDFANSPLEISYTNHKWFSSYHNDYHGAVEVEVEVTSVSPVLRWSRDNADKFQICRSGICL